MEQVKENDCPIMLTIAETSKRCGISYDFIRKMCLSNQIVYVRAGTKYLINWQKFKEYLNGGCMNGSTQ